MPRSTTRSSSSIERIDLGIAVDLDYEGLIVPVIRDADTKSVGDIAREVNDLASRARARKLTPDDVGGATFTISNNGSAGSVLTMAIINQPQVESCRPTPSSRSRW